MALTEYIVLFSGWPTPPPRPPGTERAHLLLWQVELLWRRGIIDYVLLRAVRS
jgi:hypothetical protein